MEIIKTVDDMKHIVRDWRKNGFSVGLVPTMGYLHEGHLSLVEASKKENDKTIMTIFVNPKQFGEDEDLDIYPRDLSGDIEKGEKNGVDAVFAPSVTEMYPCGFNSLVDVKGVSEGMTGTARPGHFQGVCTVVTKLFNICMPDRAYFGQKDAQQLAVIKKMVKDLDMNLEVVGCPTVRESDGLAMSSRNSYLDIEDRKTATNIFKALSVGIDTYEQETTDAVVIKNKILNALNKNIELEVDYLEIVDPICFTPRENVSADDLCLISVKVGETTLIDNIIF